MPGVPVDLRCTPTVQAGAGRDVLLLDIALDNWFRTHVERVEKSALSGDSLVDLVAVVLQNAVIAGESEELGQVCSLCLFCRVREDECGNIVWDHQQCVGHLSRRSKPG